MQPAWERLADGVHRCRLPFLDVTVGAVLGADATLLIDTGSTLREAAAVRAELTGLTNHPVSHIVLTHHHFDHVLGAGLFPDAEVYCAPAVAATLASRRAHLRADALRHGADPGEIDDALAAVRVPRHQAERFEIDLGGRIVAADHPGVGHTDHDLIVVVAGAPPVVFCGDLVEESGEPAIDAGSDPCRWPGTLDRVLAAGGPGGVYVPGHGAAVDADFVRAQRDWLRARA